MIDIILVILGGLASIIVLIGVIYYIIVRMMMKNYKDVVNTFNKMKEDSE
jgi:preprotein translocase subunit YajC